MILKKWELQNSLPTLQSGANPDKPRWAHNDLKPEAGSQTCKPVGKTLIGYKQNVKDYYHKWVEEQAQSLTNKTTAAFQQGEIPLASFSLLLIQWQNPISLPAPSPHLPTPSSWSSSPWFDASTLYGGPPIMPMMGPPPEMMPVGPTPGMRPPIRGYMPMMPGPPVMRPPAHSMLLVHWAWNDLTRQIRSEGASFYRLLLLALLHQEIMVLWPWVFSHSMTRKIHSLFLSKRE